MSKILVVDDSNSVRSMLNFLLQSEYEVVEAENGQVALDRANESEFDLILSDVNMPVMDGIEFITELRQLDDYQLTPVLVLTTESSREMKTKGKNAGATGWIVKPFQPEDLMKMIKRVLR